MRKRIRRPMMKIIRYRNEVVVFLLNLFCLSPLAYAADTSKNLCGPYPTQMIYANGMFNSFAEASKAWRKLNWQFRDYLRSKNKGLLRYLTDDRNNSDEAEDGKFYRRVVAYNTDEPALEQLQQVFLQKTNSMDIQMWKYLADIRSAPEWFVAAIASLQNREIEKAFGHDSDYLVQKELLAEYLKSKTNILLVAHSQGNFYANALVDSLGTKVKAPQSSATIKLMGVANPASYVAGSGPYVTLTTDSVIAPIPQHLPANVSNSKHIRLDHDFVDAYLRGDSSGAKMMSQLSELLRSFEFVPPPESFGDDIFDPATIRFIDRSLLPFLDVAQQWAITEEQMSRTSCLAVSVFHQILTNAGYFYSKCSDKNLDAALKLATICLKGKEDGKLTLNPRCYELGGPNPFVRKHRECKLPTKTLRKFIDSGGIEIDVRKFLENPKLPDSGTLK